MGAGNVTTSVNINNSSTSQAREAETTSLKHKVEETKSVVEEKKEEIKQGDDTRELQGIKAESSDSHTNKSQKLNDEETAAINEVRMQRQAQGQAQKKKVDLKLKVQPGPPPGKPAQPQIVQPSESKGFKWNSDTQSGSSGSSSSSSDSSSDSD